MRTLNSRALICTLVLATTCGTVTLAAPSPGDEQRPALAIAVSIQPQAFFVARIGGDHVVVQVLIGPGESPASYDPTPSQVVELAGADAYLRIGVPMENSLLPRIERGLPDLRVFDLREGIELQLLGAADDETPDDKTPDHGHHSHQHGETDPHIWLSPRLASAIAGNIAAALIDLDPEQRAVYTDNLARLQADLNSVDTEISAQLAPLRGRSLFVVHPAFGYFARDYGLVQVAIQRGGLAPGVRHLAEVLQATRREGAGALFVQPQFSTAAARNLAAETGLELVVLDPLARDYLLNLRAMANAISSALDPSGANR